jgi:hypothetical protein
MNEEQYKDLADELSDACSMLEDAESICADTMINLLDRARKEVLDLRLHVNQLEWELESVKEDLAFARSQNV